MYTASEDEKMRELNPKNIIRGEALFNEKYVDKAI